MADDKPSPEEEPERPAKGIFRGILRWTIPVLRLMTIIKLFRDLMI